MVVDFISIMANTGSHQALKYNHKKTSCRRAVKQPAVNQQMLKKKKDIDSISISEQAEVVILIILPGSRPELS